MHLDRVQKIFILFCMVFGFICIMNINNPDMDDHVHPSYLDKLNLSGVDRIMIVAHPDDESLWGGAHLAQHRYFVVCLTNAKTYNYRRYWEFKNAMKITDTPNVIMDYPDYENGHRIDWSPYEKDIEKDIRLLLSYRDWKEIATHNPDGEYGHQHHIATSRIVTKACRDGGLYDRLNYFGIYQWDIKDVKNIVTVSREYLEVKQKMFRPYYRERNTIKKHRLMHPYEQWIKASDWNRVKNKQEQTKDAGHQ